MLHKIRKKNINQWKDDGMDVFVSDERMPKFSLNDKPVQSQAAYRLIKDKLIDEGNARQNLATFCQTYMEPEATQLMAETLAVNAIDKSEYPQMSEIENRCVNIIGDLWNAEAQKAVGTSTVGSSEACMLGGLAMKFRWRNQAIAQGIDISKHKPNLVISSAYQVCWEKFCVYWDIELRVVPLSEEHMSMNMRDIAEYLDDYTIGVVGILGITYTGKFDDIQQLDEVLEQYNKTARIKVGIHVDAASGGMFVPFTNPSLLWDFRLKHVHSINTSGHKYGLVYPGIGWILWRDVEYLPKELVFDVSYLGGTEATMAINFSRSGSQIIGQYYVFFRYGFEGLKLIQEHTQKMAVYIANELKKINIFTMYNEGENIPIVCYRLKNDHHWSLYELADRLAMKGWQVPTYTLPVNLDEVVVQRLVIRSDFSFDMAENLITDFKMAIAYLEKNVTHDLPGKTMSTPQGFTH